MLSVREASMTELGRWYSALQRFGYVEVPFSYRLGSMEVTLTAKPVCGTAEIAPVARRMILDYYSLCLRPSQMEGMLHFDR